MFQQQQTDLFHNHRHLCLTICQSVLKRMTVDVEYGLQGPVWSNFLGKTIKKSKDQCPNLNS